MVLGGSCPGGGGNCPRGSCPMGVVAPGVVVPRVVVLGVVVPGVVVLEPFAKLHLMYFSPFSNKGKRTYIYKKYNGS